MKYQEFEAIINPQRMGRYLSACQGNTRKAMTLYRLNLKLSQELFTTISCFEIALRNRIDSHLRNNLGNDWLWHGVQSGGIFDNIGCIHTTKNIKEAVHRLKEHYTHHKLVAELGFGFWRYLFASQQFNVTGRTLLRIFPLKPPSSPALHYNHKFVFNQLAQINILRNRIAHHEPICFVSGFPIKSARYVQIYYGMMSQIFMWMEIDDKKLLFGLSNINHLCERLEKL